MVDPFSITLVDLSRRVLVLLLVPGLVNGASDLECGISHSWHEIEVFAVRCVELILSRLAWIG